jgi:hypothetical protein
VAGISVILIMTKKEGGRGNLQNDYKKYREYFSAKYRHPEFARVAGH